MQVLVQSLSEQGPNGGLAWLLWTVMGGFALVILAGWIASRSTRKQAGAPRAAGLSVRHANITDQKTGLRKARQNSRSAMQRRGKMK